MPPIRLDCALCSVVRELSSPETAALLSLNCVCRDSLALTSAEMAVTRAVFLVQQPGGDFLQIAPIIGATHLRRQRAACLRFGSQRVTQRTAHILQSRRTGAGCWPANGDPVEFDKVAGILLVRQVQRIRSMFPVHGISRTVRVATPSAYSGSATMYRFVLLKFSPADTQRISPAQTGLPVLRKRSMMKRYAAPSTASPPER